MAKKLQAKARHYAWEYRLLLERREKWQRRDITREKEYLKTLWCGSKRRNRKWRTAPTGGIGFVNRSCKHEWRNRKRTWKRHKRTSWCRPFINKDKQHTTAKTATRKQLRDLLFDLEADHFTGHDLNRMWTYYTWS